MSKEGLDTMLCAVTNKKLMTDIKSKLDNKFDSKFNNSDSAVKVTFTKGNEEVQASCQDYQINIISPGFQNIAVTTFCMPEVLALVDADVWVCGVPWAKLPVDNMSSRKDAMAAMKFGDFKALATASGGFFVSAASGAVLVIPTGMLVLTATTTSDGKHMSYVRWGVMQASDIPTVRASLHEMIVSYPFLSTSDYNVLLKLCGNDVADVAVV